MQDPKRRDRAAYVHIVPSSSRTRLQHKDLHMVRAFRLFLISIVLLFLPLGMPCVPAAETVPPSHQWKITSIKVCRDSSGNLLPHMEVIGSYPVYSFFIPRPVWTVNGVVVEAQPIYERGQLVAFRLFGAAPLLNAGTRNTIKLSLPDQNTSKVFRYEDSKPAPGDCYEFF